MDKKKWIVIILIIALVVSGYYNYSQYIRISHMNKNITFQQSIIFQKACSEIYFIVSMGYKALATNDKEKANEYLDKFLNRQYILNRHIFISPPGQRTQYFQETEHILDGIRNLSGETAGHVMNNGFSQQDRVQLNDYLEDYMEIGEYFRQIAYEYDPGGHSTYKFRERAESILEEMVGELNEYQYAGHPYYNLSEEEKEEIEEEYRKKSEEHKKLTEEFKPEAVRIARNTLKQELEGFREIGITHWVRNNILGVAVGFQKSKVQKYVDITLREEIVGYRVDYAGIKERPVKEINLTREQAVEKAKEFMDTNIGISEVVLDSASDGSDGRLMMQFNEIINGIILGLSQIDIIIALDNGEIEMFERDIMSDEMMEQVKEAVSKPPALTREEAKALIGDYNEVLNEGELYYKYVDGLTWRFEVKTGSSKQIIYIDANTGEEADIWLSERI